MKKLSLVLVFLIVLESLCLLGVPAFAADVTLKGAGTSDSPYLIGTENELIAFRNLVNTSVKDTESGAVSFPNAELCAELTGNITLTADWARIGYYDNGSYYSGTFDGKGYTISGYDVDGGSQYGFIGHSKGATIKNLTIDASKGDGIRGYHQFGIFVGVAATDSDGNATTLTNCAAYGDITTTGGNAGGLVGAGAAVVTNCYYVGDISGSGEIAGIGKDCVATNCFVYGNLTTSNYAWKVSNKSADNCYYLSANGTNGTHGHGTQKNADAFIGGEVALLLGDAFGQTIGVDKYPVFKTADNTVYKTAIGTCTNDNTEDGSAEKPYTIASEASLIAFRNAVNAGSTSLNAKLVSDIALTSKWTPIGTSEKQYSGTFDGNGFKISGINGSGGQWGFFKYTNGGEIKNLTIEAGNNGTINVYHQSALFVAIASNKTKITNCAGYANITTSDGYIGGITCQGECIVTDCYFVGNITGANWVTGMGYNAVATNCFVYGNIKGTSTAYKISNGNGTDDAKNFYLSIETPGIGGRGTQKSADAFASGEVAYLLGDAFGQTIGVDKYPVFKTADNTVYKTAIGTCTNDNTEDGSAEKPYTIGSYSELVNFRTAVNAGSVSLCAKLTADIALSDNWTAIGTSTNKYSGTFDGNGYEITNLKGSGNNDAAWGLFGYTNGGEIKNITVSTGSDSAVAIGHQAALLVGIASNNTKISKCIGLGDISGWGYIGGIAYRGACIVENCYYVGNITGASDVTGMGYDSQAKNCFVYGNITATTNAFRISNNANTENCYFLSSAGDKGTGGYGTQKSAEAFASGEVTYLLNRGAKGLVFGQTVGTDAYPVWYNGDNMIYQTGSDYGTSGTFAVINETEVTVLTTQNVYVMLAQYKDDVLVSLNPVAVNANETYNPQITQVSGADKYKIFVWTNIYDLSPVCVSDTYEFPEV